MPFQQPCFTQRENCTHDLINITKPRSPVFNAVLSPYVIHVTLSLLINVPLSDIDNEYCNEHSERRTAALHQLKAVLKEKLGREQVPPPFWAFCQVSDVSRLQEMVFIVEQAPNAKIAQLCLEPTIKDCDSAVARWLQNLSAINTTSSVQKARSEQHLGANQEQLRDSGISLASFWEEERVEQWKKEIFSDPQNLKEPNDGCFNMVSLDKHPHALWGAGTYKEDGEPEYRPIASGDVFSLTTDDPDKLPLPSWPLLEMQWHLQRIAGMSGAEASEDLDHNVDDDDDDDDNDAKEITTHDRDATVRSVRAISEWLRLLPEKEQSTSHPRLSIPV
ncbi:hypothetical protein BDBG_03803 [Blastomyces gilchristii SLH14081]|uniref:Uncharacterized protein n=1 Tax=Blastomyces gilchristii (strain SLH14081) TaxID=559298 RepID=A0A179UL82_BLAGS|nr:uncharacterized protein BDBG_03803 [Blastomyces gilchristii SLH14081]OAT07771.1 hypothetical protein BDBG_03803 [Blastomyces gilchristii SLH14081]